MVGVKRGPECKRPVGWQCAPEFVGLEGGEEEGEEEGRRGEKERRECEALQRNSVHRWSVLQLLPPHL